MEDDLAVRVSLEPDVWTKAETKGLVIVNFAVYGKDEIPVWVKQGLCARICTTTRQ